MLFKLIYMRRASFIEVIKSPGILVGYLADYLIAEFSERGIIEKAGPSVPIEESSITHTTSTPTSVLASFSSFQTFNHSA